MPKLLDTTIRLLSQEPLSGSVPAGVVLEIAEILDQAGFACLEVSGGGAFDAAVKGGVESPWERIRALDARTTTPLGMALRGRFLVGSRPVSGDVVKRFVSCAAENGIEVFRLHDPLNDTTNLREAGEAIVDAGGAFHAGLVYSKGRTGDADVLVERALLLPELGATRIILSDPTDALAPAVTEELIGRLREATGLPIGLHVQGAVGTALLNATVASRVGADLIATAIYPLALTLHRVASESLAEALLGLGRDTGIDVARLWEASDVVDEHIGDEPVAPVPPRIAVRAAEHDVPAGLVLRLDFELRQRAAGDRLLETLKEVQRIRAEVGWPPLASPIGQILGSQALLNVLSARRYGSVLDSFRALVAGEYGTPPAEVEEGVRATVAARAQTHTLEDDPPSEEDVGSSADGLASSEEELVLLALFGPAAEDLLRSIRRRHSSDGLLLEENLDAQRNERIRELVQIVQESGVGEIEIEDEGMRVSVRRADDPVQQVASAAVPVVADTPATNGGVGAGLIPIESPMVGVFYRSSNPGAPPFVELGDRIQPGQVICLLEAMKLFNELKAETAGIVRAIRAENGQPVEFGTVLFEIEPS
ncbi:MAG: acetyl-CoA carboxylase biotin carboxyl carrier protein [Gaiella sp.]